MSIFILGARSVFSGLGSQARLCDQSGKRKTFAESSDSVVFDRKLEIAASALCRTRCVLGSVSEKKQHAIIGSFLAFFLFVTLAVFPHRAEAQGHEFACPAPPTTFGKIRSLRDFLVFNPADPGSEVRANTMRFTRVLPGTNIMLRFRSERNHDPMEIDFTASNATPASGAFTLRTDAGQIIWGAEAVSDGDMVVDFSTVDTASRAFNATVFMFCDKQPEVTLDTKVKRYSSFDPFLVRAVFSEPVSLTGGASGFDVTGGTVTNISETGRFFDIEITPDSSGSEISIRARAGAGIETEERDFPGNVKLPSRASNTLVIPYEPTISVSATPVTEGSGDGGITLTSSGPAPFGGIDVALSVTPTSPATNADFQSLPSSATIPAGQSSVLVDLRPVDDDIVEPTEEAVIEILNASNGASISAQSSARLSINDNDVAFVNLRTDPVSEDVGTLDVTMRLDGNVQNGFSLDLATTSGTAVIGDDFDARVVERIAFVGTNGEEITRSYKINADTVVEDDETFVSTISNIQSRPGNRPFAPSSVQLGSPVTNVILNDDSQAPTFSLVAGPDGNLTASGSAAPNATVSIRMPDNERYTTVAANDGTFSVTSTLPQPSGRAIGTATTPGLTESSNTTVSYTDTVPPLPPIVDSIVANSNGTLTATVSAEPRTRLLVALPSSERLERRLEELGTVTFTSLEVQNSGRVTFVSRDRNGNESDPTIVDFIDGAVPLPPIYDQIIENSDRTATVIGQAEPNASIVLTFPSGETVSGVVNSEGEFELSSTSPQDSGEVIAALTDASGNVSLPVVDEFFDTTPPEAPTVDLERNEDLTITVFGVGEPGATVNVQMPSGEILTTVVTAGGQRRTINASLIQGVVDLFGPASSDSVGSIGTFEVTSTQPQGSGDVEVYLEDASSNASEKVVANYESPLPTPEISVTANSNGTLTVTGTAIPSEVVRVTMPLGEVVVVTATAEGTYRATSTTVQRSGTVTTTVPGSDPGEQLVITANALDDTPPEAPVIEEIAFLDNGTLRLNGRSEPLSTVVVNFVSGRTQSTETTDDGYFEMMSEEPETPGVLRVTAVDLEGNESDETVVSATSAAPTVVVSSTVDTLSIGETAVVNFVLSEPSPDFSISSIEVTGGTLSNFEGADTVFSALLSPNQDLQEQAITVAVPSGAFSNTVGVQNADGSEANNRVSFRVDTLAPSVVLRPTRTTIRSGDTFRIAASFSERVTGFDDPSNDVVVVNGVATRIMGGPELYEVEIRASGTGAIEIFVPAGAAQDPLGNQSAQSNEIIIEDTSIEDTQKLIANYLSNRAQSLVSNQPSLSRFLSPIRGQYSSYLRFSANVGRETLAFRSIDKDRRIWSEVEATFKRDNSSRTEYAFGALGVHWQTNDQSIFGFMAQLDYSSRKSEISNETIQGVGVLIGPYFAAKHHSQDIFFEWRFLQGVSFDSVSPFGTYRDNFRTQRTLVQFALSGELEQPTYRLFPSAKFSYTKDKQRSYTDSLGNRIPSQGFSMTELSLGVDFVRPIEAQIGDVDFFGGVHGIYTKSAGSGAAVDFVPDFENGRARVKSGVTYQRDHNSRLSFEAVYDGIGNDDYESYGITVSVKFNF